MKPNGQTKSKAAKPGPARASRSRERLKPERVEIGLANLPGWKLRGDGRAILRHYPFADPTDALTFLDTLQALGHAKGRLPQVDLRTDGAMVRFPTPLAGWITAADYELALALGAEG